LKLLFYPDTTEQMAVITYQKFLVVGLEVVFLHMRYKGQMAGEWNNISFEILVATDAGHCLVGPQLESIASLVGFANAFVNAGKKPIKYMLSHGEAQGSKEEGTIANLDDFRKSLSLSNDNKAHDQAPLPK
jgi:hypothetical protein